MAWKISIADDNHAICQRWRLVQRKASVVAENSLQNIFKVDFSQQLLTTVGKNTNTVGTFATVAGDIRGRFVTEMSLDPR